MKGSDGSFLNNKSKTGHIDLVEKVRVSYFPIHKRTLFGEILGVSLRE